MNSILDILNIPFGYVLEFIYKLIPNYAVTLLIFAIFVKLLLFPFGIKQQKNMVKQASLRPKEMVIRKKYAGRTDKATQQKMQEEIMALYQQENFSPLSGCLPLLLQFPVIISLYNVIRNPLTYLCHLSATQIHTIQARISELYGASYIQEIELVRHLRTGALTEFLPEGIDLSKLPNFTIFGGAMDLSATPSFTANWLVVIPILTFVAAFLSMKLTRKFSYQPPQDPGAPDANASMKIMDYTMPLFSVWLAFTVPAILGVYWIYQNILSVVQQYALYKIYPIPQFSDEELKRIEKELAGKNKNKSSSSSSSASSSGSPSGNGQKVRSLHHIDDDEFEEIYGKKSDQTAKPAKKQNAAPAPDAAPSSAPAPSAASDIATGGEKPVLKDDRKDDLRNDKDK